MAVICIEGTIGSGKSSLASLLGKEIGTEVFYESVEDNPVLPLFYEDPNKYAFLLQIYFLNTRFKSIKDALGNSNNILDRNIYGDSILFHLNSDLGRANPMEVEVYDALLANMMEELNASQYKKRPDLLVHVKASFPKMLERIKKRGRSYEQLDYDPTLYTYYEELNKRYDQWYKDFDLCPKLQVNGDKYDFINSPEDARFVLNQIKGKLKEIKNL